MNKKIGFTIAARPWYEWLLVLVWLFVEIFLLQNAVTSGGVEGQPAAATIFWVMFAVVFLAGAVVLYLRRPK